MQAGEGEHLLPAGTRVNAHACLRGPACLFTVDQLPWNMTLISVPRLAPHVHEGGTTVARGWYDGGTTTAARGGRLATTQIAKHRSVNVTGPRPMK